MIFQDCLPDSQNAALQGCDDWAASIAFRLKCGQRNAQSTRNLLAIFLYSIGVRNGIGN
jgi:hypothetical protein